MTPKEECEVLLDALLPAAEDLLKKHTEFYPIGAVLTLDSRVSFTGVLSDSAFPESQEVIDELIACHRQKAEHNEIKASAIAWNAVITTSDNKKSDAVIIRLEHCGDYSVTVGIPYKIGLFRKIHFGALFAEPGKHDIFQSNGQ